jgi:hypothetical protein
VNRCRRLAALLVLALGGCAQVVTGQGQAASAPYSHKDGGTMPRRWRRRLQWHAAFFTDMTRLQSKCMPTTTANSTGTRLHGVRRICEAIARACGEMPRRIFATQLLDELPQQLTPRSVPRTSDPAGFFDTPVEKSGLFSETGNKRTAAPQLTIGTLLYLVSLGMVAAATVGAFFGIGFLLLAHPKEEPIAGAGTRDFGAEVSPWRSSLLPRPDNAASPPPETELPDPTAAAAHPVPPPQGLSAREVLTSGYHETGQSSEQRSTTANAPASTTNDASSGQTVPVLGSTTAQAALIAPIRVTHAAGVGRHRREGARKHWAAVSRSGPAGRAPDFSRPEPAGRWIVQSVSRILASLSPPRW